MEDSSTASAIANEHRRCGAFVAGDMDAIAALLDDELRYTHSNGSVDTKASLLSLLASGAVRYEAISPKVEHVVLIGDDGVVLSGVLTTHAVLGEQVKELVGRYTAVWRAGSDSVWRLVALQGSNAVLPQP